MMGDGGLTQPVGNGTLAIPVSRRLRPWSETDGKPALFLMEQGESAEYPVYGGPVKLQMTAEARLYTETPSDSGVPATQINSILDALETAMRPGHREQTLGGLVNWVRFGARLTIYEGQEMTNGITYIEFDILATV